PSHSYVCWEKIPRSSKLEEFIDEIQHRTLGKGMHNSLNSKVSLSDEMSGKSFGNVYCEKCSRDKSLTLSMTGAESASTNSTHDNKTMEEK
ncbi:hypothetical protein PENTCL1PPCAC_10080, partial [Pristionchus entomophagus]